MIISSEGRRHELSRLLITGRVNENTPLCVLIEIADSHRISYDQKDYDGPNFAHHLLTSIQQTKVPILGEIKETGEWRYVASFVNKHSEWPLKSLIEAYNFLMGFMGSEDPLNKIPKDFVTGTQTPANPNAVNACVLYKICVHHRLNINARTTINQMANAVKMLREDVESIQCKAKIFIERDARRIDLINTLLLSSYEIKDPNGDNEDNEDNEDYRYMPKTETSHDHLLALYHSLNDIKKLQEKIDPATDSGSIALAATVYNMDISKSRNPLREYKILRMTGRNNYRPSDPWMRYWYQQTPIIFDLSLTFNPLFPVQFYDINRLTAMVHAEGYTHSEIVASEPYELLQLAHVSETFYQGLRPNMKSTETIITLDDVSTVPHGQLLCFGQIDSPLKPISMNELIDLFESNKNFSSPFDSSSVLTDTAINKLKIIAQSPYGPDMSVTLSLETVRVRARLLESINGIEMLTQIKDAPTRELAFSYRNADVGTKHTMKNTLTQLLHVGMYMRGWMGHGDYPVINSVVPMDKEPYVAINVTNSMAEYDSFCRSLGKLGTLINNLPLVLYKDGQYHMSNCSREGYTIMDRINIVREGNSTGNIASCIRLSSNWLCSSAHKYMMAIGLPPPFDIFSLRHIS